MRSSVASRTFTHLVSASPLLLLLLVALAPPPSDLPLPVGPSCAYAPSEPSSLTDVSRAFYTPRGQIRWAWFITGITIRTSAFLAEVARKCSVRFGYLEDSCVKGARTRSHSIIQEQQIPPAPPTSSPDAHACVPHCIISRRDGRKQCHVEPPHVFTLYDARFTPSLSTPS